ncbi:MAG: cyclic pyranopterin monophosphate synthase MoaC [Pseudomonadota bacterium]
MTKETDKPLTHFDESGRARMVDVSEKPETTRIAVAEGWIRFSEDTFKTVRDGKTKKGDVARLAELAGIMGAKRTSDVIPLCHLLPLSGARVHVEAVEQDRAFRVVAEIKTTGKTGVEMEALTAVSVACLTIYDMTKAVDKSMVIDGIRLTNKSGGASGDYSI